MNRKPLWQALGGIALLAVGGLWVYVSSRAYTERHVIAATSACRVDMMVVQKRGATVTPEGGAVVLFHGLAANKHVMTYLARSFAELGLTVFVPDLPGHGRTAGPFTPETAQNCATSLVRGLSARGLIAPNRTILAGHSMGGAIALRVAPDFRPAGVIAISPAPMRAAHGVTPEKLLYQSPPRILSNTLVTAGRFEPLGLTANAADLMSQNNADATSEFHLLPRQSHVSVLFAPGVARMAQAWAARVFHVPNSGRVPSLLYFGGGLLGLVGILVLAGPFLREMAPATSKPETAGARAPSPIRWLFEVAAVSIAMVFVLRYVVPLKVLGLFEGDYLASFFLLTGTALLLLHPKLAQRNFPARPSVILMAAVGALILHLLVTGWFDLTITDSWLTLQRWARFPLFFLATFFFLYGLEILLGPVEQPRKRYVLDLLAILLAWMAVATGAIFLHSGEILPVLLGPYFALFFVFSRLGARLVRQCTASATAAAVFGAILLAGFCLVLFPVS
jgi:pimeloyl-ACP methyl ester carboxylesterase